MADETSSGIRYDPDRTDRLPVLSIGAADSSSEFPTDSPTVIAAAVGIESTQPSLLALSPADGERSAALLRELDEARVTIEGLKDRQGRLAAELESLRRLVPHAEPGGAAPLQATVAEHESERSGWREARDAAFADVKRLSAELATADASLAKLRRELASVKGTLARTRATLAERDAELEALRAGMVAGGGSQPETPPVPTLIVLAGAPPGAVLLGTRTRIGRADDNDLIVDAPSVSRHHAIVIAGARGVFIEDLNSVNGLYVNRKRVRQARLADGDLLGVGAVMFRYSGPAAASVAEDETRSA